MRNDPPSGSAALSPTLNISELIRQIVRETVAEALASVPTTPQTADPDELLTLAQAAKALNVCRSQIDKLIRYHGLPYTIVGATKRVPRGLLRKWTEAQIQTGAA